MPEELNVLRVLEPNLPSAWYWLIVTVAFFALRTNILTYLYTEEMEHFAWSESYRTES